MKWIKQTDPNSLPGWICPECGSLVVQADKDAPPPNTCSACGAGGDGK